MTTRTTAGRSFRSSPTSSASVEKLHDAGIDVNPANLIDLSRSLLYIDIANYEDFLCGCPGDPDYQQRRHGVVLPSCSVSTGKNRIYHLKTNTPPAKKKNGNGAGEARQLQKQFPARGWGKLRVVRRNRMAIRNKTGLFEP